VVRVRGARGEKTAGIVVDAVSDVCSIAKDDLKQTPDLGGGSAACVSGLATVAEKMVMLLDIDALVASCIESDAPASSAA
jgi:purine-binding chemotaxis protein CheW